MPGIDELLSKSLTAVIKKNLDPILEKKIKIKLFKKHGLSIIQSIGNFSKLDEILKEFLKSDASSFEQNCLMEVASFKQLNRSFIVTIKDNNLVNSILQILGDDEYRQIIESTVSKSLLISEIIDMYNLPKTSGYRKINYLIRNGFLIGTEKEFTLKRRSVEKYIAVFQKLNFEISENQKIIKLTIPTKTIQQSSSVQIITT